VLSPELISRLLNNLVIIRIVNGVNRSHGNVACVPGLASEQLLPNASTAFEGKNKMTVGSLSPPLPGVMKLPRNCPLVPV